MRMRSNKVYLEVVTPRVIRLRNEVVSEFERLGLVVMQNSHLLHEDTIAMAIAIGSVDDDTARAVIRPMVQRQVMKGPYATA